MVIWLAPVERWMAAGLGTTVSWNTLFNRRWSCSIIICARQFMYDRVNSLGSHSIYRCIYNIISWRFTLTARGTSVRLNLCKIITSLLQLSRISLKVLSEDLHQVSSHSPLVVQTLRLFDEHQLCSLSLYLLKVIIVSNDDYWFPIRDFLWTSS